MDIREPEIISTKDLFCRWLISNNPGDELELDRRVNAKEIMPEDSNSQII